MNWNEGSLSRHARGKGWKEDDARQKEHFAKARARLQGAPPASVPGEPRFIPSYIPQMAAASQEDPEPEPAPSSPQPGTTAAANPDSQDVGSDWNQFALTLAMPDRGFQPRSGDDNDESPSDLSHLQARRKQQLLGKKNWAGVGGSTLGAKWRKISSKPTDDAATTPDESQCSFLDTNPFPLTTLRLANRLTGDGSFWPASPEHKTNTREANLAPREAAGRTVRDWKPRDGTSRRSRGQSRSPLFAAGAVANTRRRERSRRRRSQSGSLYPDGHRPGGGRRRSHHRRYRPPRPSRFSISRTPESSANMTSSPSSAPPQPETPHAGAAPSSSAIQHPRPRRPFARAPVLDARTPALEEEAASAAAVAGSPEPAGSWSPDYGPPSTPLSPRESDDEEEEEEEEEEEDEEERQWKRFVLHA